MIEPIPSRPGEARGWAPAAMTAVMAASSVIAVGYWAYRGLGEADTEAMESPLMMSVARQLTAGPHELYGPYGGTNPLVLIHAPLYYRAAGLLAWPMAWAGLHPVTAARVAGRLISAAGLVATLAAAYRIGRLGGRSPRSGLWSALLVAACPVLSGQPFAVRPDMAGVALQTWGAALALEALIGGRRQLGAASVLFGLAASVKQHLVAAWGVSLGLAVAGWMRGRAGPGTVARVVLPGVAVSGLIYGVEWFITSGRIWEAAIVAAAHVSRIHPGDWDMVLILFMGILDRSAGVVALIATGALLGVARRPGIGRRIAIVAAWAVIAAAMPTAAAHLYFGGGKSGAVLFITTGVVAATALAGGLASLRRSVATAGVNAALTAYLAAELGLVALLAHTSAGAWMNYGIPAAVFAAALAARAIAGAVEAGTPRSSRIAAVAASSIVLIVAMSGIKEALFDARVVRALSEKIRENSKVPRSSIFFTGRPGFNRLDGRLELVYDDWLYPVFESEGLAEPRSRWLLRAIISDPVRAIVNPSPNPMIPGTSIDLRRLRYRPEFKLEPYFYVWIR